MIQKIIAIVTLSLLITAVGCAGPGPKMFPAAPARVQTHDNGTLERWYDTTGDGRADYVEHLSVEGVIESLGWDTNGDGRVDDLVMLSEIPENEIRHLVIIMDSVPYSMVEEMWHHGRLRFCYPPGRVISPFPVMTDLSISEFFGVSPCPGVESAYYDGHRLSRPYNVYLHSGNVKWGECVDYRMINLAHAFAYSKNPTRILKWLNHELGEIDKLFQAGNQKVTIGYVVGTSASGTRMGRNGLASALIQVDRMGQAILHDTRGRARITLFSDHGINLMPSRRIPLPELLAQFGYRVRLSLEGPQDVVVPEFGMVTTAAVYTQTPSSVATDLLGIEGVAATFHQDENDDVIILSRSGRARISRSPQGRFRYLTDWGDPLALLPIVEQLHQEGSVDSEGYIDDQTLFEATQEHLYPDCVHRLWRAFNGLIENQPQVLLSIQDGWHCGCKAMSEMVDMSSTHGNLTAMSSIGFLTTMMGRPPAFARMADLRHILDQMGIQLADTNCEPLAHTNHPRADKRLAAMDRE
ncbi:MAG: hypothetical protein GXY44_14600 [Phycisphaerales bacterium]|nr:hypothetical protein [Phycisphaerales bacterium]